MRPGNVTALLCLAAGSVLATGPAAQAQPNHLRETECRDVVAGGASYTRDRLVDGLPLAPSDYPRELKDDSGRLRAHLRLATPSCVDVMYVMYVFRSDGAPMLQRVVSGSSGEETIAFDVQVGGYGDDCLAVQFETRVNRVAVDLAPDSLGTFETVCDGTTSGMVYR